MNLKDEFMAKIEAEHSELVSEIKGHTIEWLLAGMERCAAFQKAYEFLKKGDLADEYYEGLLKNDQIIATVCNAYIDKVSEEDIRHFNAVKSIVENGVMAYGCGEKVNELLRTMNEIILKNAKAGIDVSAERKLFSVVSSVASDIKDEEAELLLQFKNPIEVLMQGNVYNMFSLYTVKETAKRIGENDIYALPFERNQKNIIKDSEYKHNAVEKILHIVPKTDNKATMAWLNYFRDFNIQQGEKSVETDNLYEDFVSTLENIRGEFGSERLQQVYDFGSNPDIKYWDVFEDSLTVIAEYLDNDGEIGEVNEMAQSGYFLQPYEDLQKQLEQGEPFGMSMN